MFLYPHDTTIQHRLPVPFLFTSRTCAKRFIWRRKTEIYEVRFCELAHREKTHGEKNVNKQARALAIFNSRNPISIALWEVREKENFAAVNKIKFKFIRWKILDFSKDILEINGVASQICSGTTGVLSNYLRACISNVRLIYRNKKSLVINTDNFLSRIVTSTDSNSFYHVGVFQLFFLIKQKLWKIISASGLKAWCLFC